MSQGIKHQKHDFNETHSAYKLYNTIELLFMIKKSKKLHKNSRALISCTEVK